MIMYIFLILVMSFVQPVFSTVNVRANYLRHPEYQTSSLGWELSSANWDAVAVHLKNLVKFPPRKLRHVDFSIRVSADEESADEKLGSNLRMFPEHVSAARKFFDILDTNDDQHVDLPEFLNAMDANEPAPPAANSRVLREAGQEIFENFATEKYMQFPNFCRFLVAMSYQQPSDFKWHNEDLEALRDEQLVALKNHSSAQLMKTFVVFDKDSSGNIDEDEFEQIYMGHLYWTLRSKEKLPSGILDTHEEYRHALTRFDRYSSGTGILGFRGFLRLVEDAAEHKPPHPKGGGKGCLSCRLTPDFVKSGVVHQVSQLCTLKVFIVLLSIIA